MKPEFKSEALEIISKSNSIRVSFNVPVTDSYSNTYEILIHECNASTVDAFIKMGFKLSMTPKGMSVNKY